MSSNYATEKVTAAIKSHLIAIDVLPPKTDATRLASEITEVVWTQLSNAGLSREAVEQLFAPASEKAKSQGRA